MHAAFLCACARARHQLVQRNPDARAAAAMAGDGATTYKGGIKAYWKRRGYGRLDAASAQRRPRLPTAELGDGGRAAGQQQPGGRRSRRGWHVRRRGLGRRILRALSPQRLLARLRDAYVGAMLRLASSAAVAGTAPYGPAGADPFARPRPLKEYDEKALVEIYRSILARGGGVVPVAGDAAAVVAVARLPTVA
ncbi:hypothetical protein E2562_018477 [Oryza meyeriana var. granulata]|uniref:Uncharacterized protein n=1 Tax=Oryza meyeriana var. granulata TaxID=110450 RepID=A0A6G1EMI5_9ORYZ|nr:hypothetical protein E2562_018477 [Oryza meyeriana var. granulata]